MKQLLDSIGIEEIHKRFSNSPLHSIHAQMVSDVKKLRELGKDITLCEQLLADLNKAVVHRTDLKFIYAGMICILNLLLETANA